MRLRDQFSERKRQFSNQLKNASSKAKWIAWIRTLIFLGLLYMIYLLLDNKDTTYLIPIGFAIVSFGFLVVLHQKSKTKADLLNALISMNEDELQRLNGNFAPSRNGDTYIDEKHPYAADLDLFGEGSLFQQVNRIELTEGEATLATALTSPLEIADCLERQHAIRILTDQLSWRQNWQAALRVSKGQKDPADLKIEFPSTIAKWQLVLSSLLVIATLGLMASWIFFGLPFEIFMGILPINLLLLGMHQRALTKFGFDSSVFTKKLNGYIQAIKLIQKVETQDSQLLDRIRTKLGPEAENAWRELAQLIYTLDSRANILYWIINPLVFIDVILQHQLAKWHKRNQTKLPEWVDAVHEMEVIVSMAGYTFLHHDFFYPKLVSDKSLFHAESLGHPLIPDNQVVTNDFAIENEKVALVTGSNMSGKSTFLRTVGLAHVMSWVGLPVKAKKLRISRFDLFTSMRVSDDLSTNTSSFYAELKRIKKLLDQLENNNTPILYFLDEILKGTNSHDRHKGAIGLIQKLIKSNSFGFISTHDLELAVEYKNQPAIKNYSFNSSLKNNKLHFDYLISNTICQSSNASKLMANMGIIVDDTES